MADNARLTRKEIKQPDQFHELSGQVVRWGRAHQQAVIATVAGVVVLLAAVGIFGAYRAAQLRDANADLAGALAKLDSADYAGAATALSEVSTRWSNTQVGPVAALLAANSALRAAEVDRAIAALGAVDAAALPDYLQQQRLLAWGAALEAKQQWDEAAARYRDAAALSGPYTGDAVVGEARTLEQAGQKDKAKELYRKAYDQFPELPGREMLSAKVSS